jgi:purine-nucleoside phosphorylase
MGEDALIRRAASFLRSRLSASPQVAIILGSGMGDLDLGPVADRIPYAAIPGFPRPGVAGHAGLLAASGRAVVLSGRAHYYEGRSMDEVIRPVRVLARLGVRTLVVTNAAGAVNRAYRPGDLMLIRDHLNLMGVHPLRGGPRFVDLTEAYDPALRAIARSAARRVRIRLREGVYAAMPGPSYETPAEIRMLRALGADAVGMSTVPETIAAREAGVRVLGISLVTNFGAGMHARRRPGGGGAKRPVSHEEVLETSAKARGRMERLLRQIVAGLRPPGTS